MDADEFPQPDHAPLPVPFWQVICQQRLAVPAPPQVTPKALKEIRLALEQEWTTLLRDLETVREHAFALLDPLVRDGLRRPDLVRLFQQHANGPSRWTYTLWQRRGLLRYRGDHPDPQSAAALLVARLLLPQMKASWLPSEMAPDEPLWWCWRQDTPDSPILPCPFPIPADVPEAARLWTPWRGVEWLQQDGRIVWDQKETER
jgi:hypothetical protein